MAWPYHLVNLTEEQINRRRELLDRYGVYAQLSAFIPIFGYQLYRLAAWVYSERRRSKTDYAALPSSPGAKRNRNSKSGMVVRKWRQMVWWFEEDMGNGWGTKGHWIAAGTWTVWLLFLVVHRTGDDYLHITKRFGQIAASQLPLHYMLSMKSRYSPLALVFHTSHEHFNTYHRISGRITYGLLFLHASFYMNFFVQASLVTKRLRAPVVIIGMIAFSLLTLLATTSLEPVRRWSYRAFFVLHLSIGVSLMPLLFFHTPHLRLYVTEALVLFILDIILRKLDTVTGFATITSIPNTNLLMIKVPVPASKLYRFHAAPGQHVYLSIPPESTPLRTSNPSIHDLLFNPFTIADVSDTDVTLVLRTLEGPTTKALSKLTNLSKARPPINIEGPLGAARNFPNLPVKYDRILLVAGGVGATFILPIYRNLRDQFDAEHKSPDRLMFIWSMRSAAEASWAFSSPSSSSTASSSETKIEFSSDPNIKIFLTRSHADDRQHSSIPADGSVELNEFQDEADASIEASGGKQRPDLKRIVNGVFRNGNEERIAVLVCGPKGMAKEIKGYVGRWVGEGRDVWFHDEAFGW